MKYYCGNLPLNTNQLDLNEVRDKLEYNPKTGELTWKKHYFSSYIGKIAGSKQPNRSINIKFNGVMFKAHRLIWFHQYGKWPEGIIDHIDGNKHNNRLENLRVVDYYTNNQNAKMRKDNTSGVKGVFFHKRNGRYHSSINIMGIKHHLGYFKNKEEAIKARIKAEKELNYDNVR